MTLAEAWRELGLDPGADPEAVRRAYLRLVRQRKPERDPDGFRRLREAYEIARAGGDFEVLAVRSEGVRPTGPLAGDPHASLEIARAAVAARPDDPQAHWLLARTLSRLESEAELAKALRAAWRKGWPEFLEALLIRVPDRTTHDDVEAAFASDRPTVRLAGAVVAARWASRRAAAVVVNLCEAAMAGTPDAEGERVRALPLGPMLDVILALHVAGALDPAAEAQAALRACLRDSGLELSLLQGRLAGGWTLTEEIDGLSHDFPSWLRAAFATAVRAGDLGSAFSETYAMVARDRGLVQSWADRLGTSAPNLQGIMQAALAYVPAPHPVERAPFRVGRLLGWIMGCIIIIGGVALTASLWPKDPPPPLHDIDGFYKGPPRAPVTSADAGPDAR